MRQHNRLTEPLALWRCPDCRMRQVLCVCAALPRLHLRTQVILVIHAREVARTSNTGLLAARCLGALVVERGGGARPEPEVPLPPCGRAYLLWPGADAVPAESLRGGDRPVTLVVPDASWPQAGKLRRRVAGLAGLPTVLPPPGPPSRYRLRGGQTPDRLSTLEAIARVLGVLEGPEIALALERALDLMVERTLWTRGKLTAAEVAGGLPTGAVQHDVWAGGTRSTGADLGADTRTGGETHSTSSSSISNTSVAPGGTTEPKPLDP